MAKQEVNYVNFRSESDPELLDKLNAVAAFTGRSVHNLTRHILLLYLNEQIKRNQISSQQPSGVGG